ncbi:MAG: invasion associated locus B family protein, partial [Hyphomicrobiaceae bacterium]
LTMGVLAEPAAAQKGKGKNEAAASKSQPQSAWVKLCEKAKVPKTGADGRPVMTQERKPVTEEKELCLTHHEQMTPAGVTLISAAIQKLEGVERHGMMVMVPPAVGLVLPSGIRVTVYNKEQWDKLNKKEKLDEKTLVRQQLVFTMCHQNGCTAENEATPALLDAMKKGVAMVAEARHPTGRVVAFSIPLTGFAATYAGKPVDNKVYNAARKKVWDQIRANQIAQLKKMSEEIQKKDGASAAGGSAPPAKKK